MNAGRLHYDAEAQSNERGSALIIVVMLLAAITVLLGSLLSGVHGALARGHAVWREQVTRAQAEAGIQRAAAQLAETAGAYRGDKDVPLGDGFYSTRITAEKGTDEYRVVAVGELRDAGRTLRRSVLAARVKIKGGRIAAIDYIDPAAVTKDSL